ncbi:MAG: TetR/AcrR family transcriptional regulator, partial [Gammaproteobacteria bacterium]|nr:TetR/AcrR family transcriptional regulator [Gammaproteobacteria bacterium]
MGRMEKKRRRTRARLLEAAYAIMSQSGVDAAKIQDVTEYADVGFGTFYNYFKSKDDLASQVLDCVIDDFGRRNVEATREIRASNPALVMPISIRLVMREAMRSPMWQWWALRPDLLVDRMTKGFGPFGLRDLEDGITRKILKISREDVEASWTLLMWV